MKARFAIGPVLLLAGLALGLSAATPAAAQEAVPGTYQQVISANPFGLLLDVFNAEYERVVSESSTAGVGGSTYSNDDNSYVNADAFWRFYPSATPHEGWAFGVKAGITRVRGPVDCPFDAPCEDPDDREKESSAHFGYGFDVNRSWLLGKNQNFYVGVGFGLKRLVGGDEGDLQYLPTFRLINVGIAF